MLYTSIPYERGWKLYVDGEKTGIEPFENALIAVPLTKGEHSITLRYTPYGFGTGVVISLAGVIVMALAVILLRRGKSDGQDIDSSALL